MKDILKIVLFSTLGGAITLGLYKVSENDTKTKHVETITQSTLPTTPVSLNTNLSNNALVDLTPAAEQTVNSVVHVTSTTTVVRPQSMLDLFYNRSRQMEQGSTGSGVIITEDGYIVTNNHVIDNADKLTVTLNNQKSYKARVIGMDKKNDIALLKIDADEKLAYIPFGNSDNAKIGEWVLAVGNPYNLTSTVTAGIISAKSRDLSGDRNVQSFIQTDAAVNPGNSGGALVNTKGELIGINTAISSQTGSYIGYSFAVPSNITRKIVEDIMEYGNVQQGILGVAGFGLNNTYADKLEINQTEGYYISDIEPKSGAEKAGLKPGDIIKKIDNVKISKSSDLTGYLSAKRPNNTVSVKILRDGKTKTLSVKLSDKTILTKSAFGMELKNLTNLEKENLDIKSGLKVIKSPNNYLAEKLGIGSGCIITQINERPIESIDDLENFKSLSLSKVYNIEVVYKNGQSKNWWLQ